MAPASKLSKRTPLSDASSDEDDDSSSDSGSESGVENGLEEDNIPEVNVDVTKLTSLSPEVIQKQATINIGVSSITAAAFASNGDSGHATMAIGQGKSQRN